MPEKKEWVWGFLGPIPFLQQRFVPDVVIQQDRRGRVIASPAGGAGNQPTPAAPAVPVRPAFTGRIAEDDLAREKLEEAQEREMAADLQIRAERSLIMADLKTEAVWAMQNARTARTLAWANQLPVTSPIVDQGVLEEIASPPQPEHRAQPRQPGGRGQRPRQPGGEQPQRRTQSTAAEGALDEQLRRAANLGI